MWFATQKNIVIISLFDIILFGNVRKMWRRQFMFFYSRILIQRFLMVSRSKVVSTRTTWYSFANGNNETYKYLPS